jgi:formylglycine-generating enzyme
MKFVCPFVFFLCHLVLFGQETLRDWTDLNGRKMQATFVEFSGDKAVFKRVDGSLVSLPPSVFCAKDRSFLMNLDKSDDVSSSSVDDSVEFLQGATIVVSVMGEAFIVGPSRIVPDSNYNGDHRYERNSSSGLSASAPVGLRIGSIVAFGSQIRVEQHSEVVLLFSNGTIATIGANTRMMVKEFQQQSFGPFDGNFSQEEEVSSSRLLLDLESGDLVVDVKKLKRSSSFEVSTPLGIAGIRGTVFKIISLADTAKLSVLSGRVDFVSSLEKVIPTTANQSLYLQAEKEPQLGNLSDDEKESMTKTIDSARKQVADMELAPLYKALNFNKHTVPFAADMQMLWVDPGSFFMGSPITESGRQAIETKHEVTTTRGFYLGVHEVTQMQYEAVMAGNTDVLSPTPSRFNGEKHPVERVSWNDVQVFLARLNERERIAGRLSTGWVYMLPSEAEWEYACRAGTVTVFSLGNTLSAMEANFRGASPYGPKAQSGPSAVRTKPVGSYAPNPWGFYDMHGNVWEWTADWFGRYPIGIVSNPKGAVSGFTRVKRGGSWYLPATYLRSASRSGSPPADRSHDLGFRLAFKQLE